MEARDLQQPIPPSVLSFFAKVDSEVVSEIEDNHKLIRYTIGSEEQKDGFEAAESQSILMLVSYQLLGQNQEIVSISLFEFDQEDNCINPNNFVIVTQKLTKTQQPASGKTQNFSIRTLSVVDEADEDN